MLFGCGHHTGDGHWAALRLEDRGSLSSDLVSGMAPGFCDLAVYKQCVFDIGIADVYSQ
jgi:hypothetical protein